MADDSTAFLTVSCVQCSGEEDDLMEEIPTTVVDKLPMGLDQGFVVLNRPYGFLQWVRKHLPHIKEAYVLMIEPDYIIMRPPPLFATPTKSAAYHFTYMLPEENREVIEPYNEKGVPFESILPIGANSLILETLWCLECICLLTPVLFSAEKIIISIAYTKGQGACWGTVLKERPGGLVLSECVLWAQGMRRS